MDFTEYNSLTDAHSLLSTAADEQVLCNSSNVACTPQEDTRFRETDCTNCAQEGHYDSENGMLGSQGDDIVIEDLDL